MLSKLSFRNAQRQARDYLVYFVSVVMAAALLYSFNGLVFSGELLALSRQMAQMPLMIVLASIVVVCVFGWLVSYSTNFMLTRRSRELGIYLLIGLENRQVARLFFQENLVVGGCALALGLVLGSLLFQALRAIVLTLFGAAYHFSLAVSLPAAGLTVVCFLLIYLRALRKSRRRIQNMMICDLIYYEKQNEGAVIKTGRGRRGLTGISLVLGAAGTVLMMLRDLVAGLIGAGCVIVFLYGFFLSFASGVPAFFERRPARKYRGQNLLVFRSLTAKLATMGVLMATISMIFTATLISEGTGMVFRGIFAGRSAESACFDLYIGMAEGRSFDDGYRSYIDREIPVEQALAYQVYSAEGSEVMDYLDANMVFYHFGYEQDPVMRYSDYAALREIAGYPAAEPGEGEYLIHCMTYLEETLAEYGRPLVLGDMVLQPGGVYHEHFLQHYGTGNGHGYILVVPDQAVLTCPVHHSAFAAKTAQPVSEAQYYALYDLHYDVGEAGDYDEVRTRAQEEADVAAMTAMTVFPLWFLALALTMTAATILTIQQLSESDRYRRHFALLRKLGMDRREMAKALWVQSAIYYALPALPAVLIGVPFILNLAKAPEPGVMVGLNSPGAIVGASLGLFALIYAVYIAAAYLSLKRSVLPDEG